MTAFGVYWLFPAKYFRPKPPRDQPLLSAAAQFHPRRPVYPYSVIRGGAYDGHELAAALESDKVAAAHYAGYFHGEVRPVTLPETRLRYVSFRKDERIYWTRRPVKLPAGETLLTDGTKTARARCGNQLSEKPQLPVLSEDPPESDWEKPHEGVDPGILPNLALSYTPAPPHSPIAPEVVTPPSLVAQASQLGAAAPDHGQPYIPIKVQPAGLLPLMPRFPEIRIPISIPYSLPQPLPVKLVPPGTLPPAEYDDPLPKPKFEPSPKDTPRIPEGEPFLLVGGGLLVLLARRR